MMPFPFLRPILASLAFCALLLAGCGAGDEGSGGDKQNPTEEPRFRMRDVSRDSGLSFITRSGTDRQRYIAEVKATGAGIFDYDGDGRMDVVLTAGSTIERTRAGEPGYGTRLYRNLGNLKFEDVTEEAGIPATAWACAPICADYDGDGDVDLYLTQIGANILLRNEGGRFVDVTAEAGLGDEGWGTSAVFHDIDGDGDLDLYLCNYLSFDMAQPPAHGEGGLTCIWKEMPVMCGPAGLAPQADRVFRNEGKGQFRDVSTEWGLDELEAAYGLGVVAGDLDADGKTELYVANDGMANSWLDWDGKQLIDEGFERSVAFGENGDAEAGMGLDACDLNGDGRQDLICTNFSGEYNDIYLSNREEDWYLETAVVSGTATKAFDHLGWGVGIRDFDLDGRWDYFVANGHVYPEAARAGTGTTYRQANHLFLGREGGRFELADPAAHPGLALRLVSRGAAFGDLDDDGDIDVVVANLNARCTLLENQLNRDLSDHHFLGLTLRGLGANRDAIGARVDLLDAEGKSRWNREVRRQASFQVSNDPRLHFGLGTKPGITRLRVTWSAGKVEFFSVQLDRYALIEEGQGEAQ